MIFTSTAHVAVISLGWLARWSFVSGARSRRAPSHSEEPVKQEAGEAPAKGLMPHRQDTFDTEDDRGTASPKETFPCAANLPTANNSNTSNLRDADKSRDEKEESSGSTRCTPEGEGRRVVSMADQHGDFEGMLKHLKLLGLVSPEVDRQESAWQTAWAGEDAIFVQTGDILDRGPDGRLMYKFLWALQDSAAESGGEIVLLMGNHELMVLQGDIRYVTNQDYCAYTADNCGGNYPKESLYCEDGEDVGSECCTYEDMELCKEGKASTCFPGNCEFLEAWDKGGCMGSELRKRFQDGKMKLSHMVNGVVFTHAGLVDSIWSKLGAEGSGAKLLDELNAEATKLFNESTGLELDDSEHFIASSSSSNGPTWTRVCYDDWWSAPGRRRRNGEKDYISPDEVDKLTPGRCETIAASLKELSATRMVIGHCPTDSGDVETSCSGSFIMADTYMSLAYTESREDSDHNMAALEFRSEGDAEIVVAYSGRGKCEKMEKAR